MISGRYFVADAQQAQRYAALGAHATGRARMLDLRRANWYRRRSAQRQRLCTPVRAKAASVTVTPVASAAGSPAPPATGPITVVPPTGAPVTPPTTGTQGSYVSPQFFGQHLMYFWSLTPAFPVHAMRLWNSITDWCDMDNGTSTGQYNFGQLDALLGQSSRLDADVEYTFGNTPNWAATGSYPQPSVVNQCDGDPTTEQPPADESYWTNFVTALVTHAKGRIHAYELWNEVDWSYSWAGSVSRMVQMSVDAAAIIHRIDPSALVLSPSITNTSEGFSWLHEYLSQLPPGTIDAIAVHSYTGGAEPEASVPAEMTNVRAALPAAYADMPIWATEGGWGENSQCCSLSDQSGFVARYDLMMLNSGFARTYWYGYPNSAWGTLQPWGGSLTPAGVASGTIYAWLAGATFSGCSTSDNNVWTCNLTTASGRPARIVWATQWAIWYPTTGFNTVDTLDGGSSAATGWIQAGWDPIMLVS
jgi:hypothetical protein